MLALATNFSATAFRARRRRPGMAEFLAGTCGGAGGVCGYTLLYIGDGAAATSSGARGRERGDVALFLGLVDVGKGEHDARLLDVAELVVDGGAEHAHGWRQTHVGVH